MTYEPLFIQRALTCHEDFSIGNIVSGLGKLECEIRCEKIEECKFFFHETHKCCGLFYSCDRLGTPNTTGTTFKKGISFDKPVLCM